MNEGARWPGGHGVSFSSEGNDFHSLLVSDGRRMEAELQKAVFDTFKAPRVPAVYVCLGKQAFAQTDRVQTQGGLLEDFWILACQLLTINIHSARATGSGVG